MIKLTFKYIDFGLQILFLVFTIINFFLNFWNFNLFQLWMNFVLLQSFSLFINSLFLTINREKFRFGRFYYNLIYLPIFVVVFFYIILEYLSKANYSLPYFFPQLIILFTSPILAVWYLTITLLELINLQKVEKLEKLN